jgi:hypothetical protein
MIAAEVNVMARKRSAPKKKKPTPKAVQPARVPSARDEQRDDVMKGIFAKAGFAMEIAKHLGVTHQNVSAWRKVPAHHVLELTKILKMSPKQIRPDVFQRKG